MESQVDPCPSWAFGATCPPFPVPTFYSQGGAWIAGTIVPVKNTNDKTYPHPFVNGGSEAVAASVSPGPVKFGAAKGSFSGTVTTAQGLSGVRGCKESVSVCVTAPHDIKMMLSASDVCSGCEWANDIGIGFEAIWWDDFLSNGYCPTSSNPSTNMSSCIYVNFGVTTNATIKSNDLSSAGAGYDFTAFVENQSGVIQILGESEGGPPSNFDMTAHPGIEIAPATEVMVIITITGGASIYGPGCGPPMAPPECPDASVSNYAIDPGLNVTMTDANGTNESVISQWVSDHACGDPNNASSCFVQAYPSASTYSGDTTIKMNGQVINAPIVKSSELNLTILNPSNSTVASVTCTKKLNFTSGLFTCGVPTSNITWTEKGTYTIMAVLSNDGVTLAATNATVSYSP